MKKLTGIAKALDILTNIFQVCCMIGAIAFAVAAVLLVFFDVEAFVFSQSLELGSFSFTLSESDPSIVRQQFLWIALPAIAVLAVMRTALGKVRRILAPMREGKPFDTAVSLHLRSLSWMALIGGAICSGLQLASEIAMYRLYDFPTLFCNGRITGCTVEAELNTDFVWLFLILFLLSCVFRYGEELQKQSDETL